VSLKLWLFNTNFFYCDPQLCKLHMLDFFTQNPGEAGWISGVVDEGLGAHVDADADGEQVVERVGVAQRRRVHAGVGQKILARRTPDAPAVGRRPLAAVHPRVHEIRVLCAKIYLKMPPNKYFQILI
jgi:hypothetical protein